jgi:hypothetical protein
MEEQMSNRNWMWRLKGRHSKGYARLIALVIVSGVAACGNSNPIAVATDHLYLLRQFGNQVIPSSPVGPMPATISGGLTLRTDRTYSSWVTTLAAGRPLPDTVRQEGGGNYVIDGSTLRLDAESGSFTMMDNATRLTGLSSLGAFLEYDMVADELR